MATTQKTWTIVGLMSGTSLDGLDLAICRFTKKTSFWEYSILAAKTVPYKKSFKISLANLMNGSAFEYAAMDAAFGKFCGTETKKFLLEKKLSADAVASHGHTIFHQPSKGFTSQIGNGAYISAITQLPVLSDFRTLDVALGGQGAPLVPVGDALLFKNYSHCLNLGGIANISYDKNGKRIAGDICPVNIVLNTLAGAKGKAYDKDGKFAANGNINAILLAKLSKLSFYKKSFPKSLGKEWVDKEVFPLIQKSTCSIDDKLATFCEHIAIQISKEINPSTKNARILITGGGAFNTFLIKRIENHLGNKAKVIVPDKTIVGYKEALIFAFLGLKKILGENNALTSVTGASQDSSGGAWYGKNLIR